MKSIDIGEITRILPNGKSEVKLSDGSLRICDVIKDEIPSFNYKNMSSDLMDMALVAYSGGIILGAVMMWGMIMIAGAV